MNDYFSKFESIIERHKAGPGSLIAILEDLQAEYHYLSKDMLILVGERLGIPLSQVYSVATFYNAFSLKPQGTHLISVCLGTACHVKGGEKNLQKIKRELKLEDDNTTEDLQFTLETVRCLGCCSMAPVIKIDEDIYGPVMSEKTTEIIKKYKKAEHDVENT